MTALAKPPTTITVAGIGISITKAELDAEHESDRAALAELLAHPDIADDASLSVLDATLSDVARLHDELVARRQKPVKQVKGLIAEFEGWFRPYLKDVDAALDALKGVKSRYLTAKDAAARKAREDAQKAADAGDSAAVLESIQRAQEIEAVGSAGTRYAWEVKRIAPDLLPDEYWIPDQAHISAVAKAAGSSEEPPVIPGVVFERVAVVQARRK